MCLELPARARDAGGGLGIRLMVADWAVRASRPACQQLEIIDRDVAREICSTCTNYLPKLAASTRHRLCRGPGVALIATFCPRRRPAASVAAALNFQFVDGGAVHVELERNAARLTVAYDDRFISADSRGACLNVQV